MSSELSLRQSELTPPFEFIVQGESFLDRLAQEPALRFQVRDALGTFSIEPERELGLGYSQRPYARISELFACLGVDTRDFHQGQLQAVTRAFMQGCFELRDDFSRYGKAPDSEPRLPNFSQLPAELQYLATFKVIERVGAADYLSRTDIKPRLDSYLTERLGLSGAVAANVTKAASIIEAPSIIADSLSYPASEYPEWGHSIELTELPPELLVGPTGPEHGIHLGSDLMNGVVIAVGSKIREIHDEPKYLAGEEFTSPESFKEWAEALRNFWPEVNRIIDDGLKLSDKPVEEYPTWRSYLFASTVYGRVFARPVVEGFDGGLDQLAAWTEPVPDNEYPERLHRLNTWVEALRLEGNMDRRGLDLAHYAFAQGVMQGLERQVIMGGKSETKGRVLAMAKLLDEMAISSPDLTENLIEQYPTIGPFLKKEAKRRADPWGYRFQ